MPTEHKHTVAEETSAAYSAGQRNLDEAAAFDKLFRSLRRRGFGACAEYIAYLRSNDDMGANDAPLSLESARGFVKFMSNFSNLGEPLLGLFSGGTLSAEWRIADNKHLLVESLDGENAAFALIGPPSRPGEKFRANGNGTIAEVVHTLRKRGIDKRREA